jgi:hypothetical protein
MKTPLDEVLSILLTMWRCTGAADPPTELQRLWREQIAAWLGGRPPSN